MASDAENAQSEGGAVQIELGGAGLGGPGDDLGEKVGLETVIEDADNGGADLEGSGREGKGLALPLDADNGTAPDKAAEIVEDVKTAGYPEEGLHAWLAVYATFAAQSFAIGLPSAWGVIQRTLLVTNEFPGATNFQLSFVGTLSLGCLTFAGIFTGQLSDRISPQLMAIVGSLTMSAALLCDSFVTQLWQFYLSQALYGIGAATVLMPATSILPSWFSKRRALALGLAVSGTGIGGFMLSAISQACISSGGWRLAFRVNAGFCLGWVGTASFFVKRRIPGKPPPRPKMGPWGWTAYFKNPVFVLLFAIIFTVLFGFFTPAIYIPIMIFDGGYGNAAGAAVVAAYSAVLAVGRILGGFASDRLGEINMLVIGCCIPGLMTMTVWMAAPTNLIAICVAAMILAFFGGAPLVSAPVLASKEFGIVGLGSVLGILYIAFGPGQLFGPSISGLIVDRNTIYSSTGERLGANYRPLLGFSGTMWLVSMCFGLALRYYKVGLKVRVRI